MKMSIIKVTGSTLPCDFMKICQIFTLTVDIKNPFCELEDIHKQIFLEKFHENLTLTGRDVDNSPVAGKLPGSFGNSTRLEMAKT